MFALSALHSFQLLLNFFFFIFYFSQRAAVQACVFWFSPEIQASEMVLVGNVVKHWEKEDKFLDIK